MTVFDVEKDAFENILKTYLTPSGSIRTPERLFGRSKQLLQIERALDSVGRQVIIYGDRGVGKTSLAQTAGLIANSAYSSPIYVVCGSNDTFETVMQSIGKRATNSETSFETHGPAGGVGVNILGVGVNVQKRQKTKIQFPSPHTINDAIEIIRYIGKNSSGRRLIVIDEMERISVKAERERFAEFIKNIPELDCDVKFIFCGIGSTVEELIGAHPSAGRILETIELHKLSHSDLWSILESVADKLKVKISKEMLVRIGQLSDGFPHYVHLIGETMFWSLFDDPQATDTISVKHFKDGIKGGLERAEATLRKQYTDATMKTKLTEDYEEALWALADTSATRRQITEIYDWSYKRITRKNSGTVLSKEKLNQRLLALRKESHGSVVVGHGNGWFNFRENILRGYVRLKAENEGIELGKDVR